MKKDVNFLYEIGTLRYIPRTWCQFLSPNFANLAEHSMRVMWIALVLANMEKAKNTDKILKMALMHDITESRTGDVHYVSRLYTKRDERKAIIDMLKDTILESELLLLWEEYEKRETIEAKIVKDADTIDVDLELCEQAARGSNVKGAMGETRKEVSKRFLTKSGLKVWKEVYRTDPDDWHAKGANRFTQGDWRKQPARKKRSR